MATRAQTTRTTRRRTGRSTSRVSSRRTSTHRAGAPGMKFEHVFSTPGVHPYDEVEWELRTAVITSEKGEVIFEQKDVEVPASWSQLATNVVVSKYFAGQLGTPQRETSLRTVIDRVARTLRDWGVRDGYFATEQDADVFCSEVTYLLLHQMAAFNSPVWFNMGIEKRPQCSACFINSVEDSMESILTLAKTEGMLFKYGSGTGTNLSTLRGSMEALNGGGVASGPVSFMRGFDAFAGVIKSGGKTRRSAKMVILDIDHPDIVEFIECKVREERKAWALIREGYDGTLTGEAYASVFFQNSNNSVRVSDEFMEAVENDAPFSTRARTDGRAISTYQAQKLFHLMAENAHICGDPGIQFDTTINHWHTCADTTRINASNPCSEYMFIDNSACNLLSVNLMRFRRHNRSFDVTGFRSAVRTLITAMDIIVDNGSYPTPRIERNSWDYRPLGLGYANLGALLMARGLPYDSVEGRTYAGAITALMCGEAYRTSAELAERCGAFRCWDDNRRSFLRVLSQHREALKEISPQHGPEDLLLAAQSAWDDTLARAGRTGVRNSQTTVLAPTGTIAFYMDCDTTGIEPDIALVKYKKLAGGGSLKIVNQTVPEALDTLGYDPSTIAGIVEHIERTDTIEGAPGLREEHLPVFDCAFKPRGGKRSIHYRGHLLMMSAVQPFLSGAISKTVNLPESATIEDIMATYREGWKLGLKSVAIYRDGSKKAQPLSTGDSDQLAADRLAPGSRAVRRRLPDERAAITHKFSVAGHEGYVTVGMYEDGSPGEIFIVMSKEGSTVSGLMDGFATAVSIALQYGVPLEVLVNKFCHTRFEPSGLTGNPEIPIAKSVLDYISRWLARKFLPAEENGSGSTLQSSDAEGESPSPPAGAVTAADPSRISDNGHTHATGNGGLDALESQVFINHSDAPPCFNCGTIMVRNGACYKCLECGSTSGCS